jgi:hypothetical protein
LFLVFDSPAMLLLIRLALLRRTKLRVREPTSSFLGDRLPARSILAG